MKDSRCLVCGKPVPEGSTAYRISKGQMQLETGWKEKTLFGLAHQNCFGTSIDSPSAVMAELKRQAREDTRS